MPPAKGENMDIKENYLEIIFLILLIGLYFTRIYSFLLFHTLSELFSIVIGVSIFIIAWNTRRFSKNDYFTFIGIAYLFISGIDLLHTMAYKGMSIFIGYDANLPTQLWILGRYTESLSLLISPIFLKRKLDIKMALISFSLITGILTTLIFSGHFPACFVEGKGLTQFKIVSEYIISIILLLALYYFLTNRAKFDSKILKLVSFSILLKIGGELAFTTYLSVYGSSNMLGHYFKLISFFLIYKALIVSNLENPYSLLFKELNDSEKKYSLLFNRMFAAFALHEIILDKDGAPCDYRFLDTNPQFETITGLKRKDVIGKTVLEIIPKTEKYWIETYGKVALEGIPLRAIMHSSPLDKYFDVSVFSPEKGKFATLFLDITDQKKLEEKLKESTKIITSSSIMLFTWKNDENWSVDYVSENVTRIIGYSHEDFINGKVSYASCIHPDDLKRVIQEVEKFSEEKDRNEFIHEPYRIITKEGNVLVVSDWTFIIRNSEGIITHYKGIIQDITEKKKIEDALKQSEEKYRELVENANSIILKYDKNGNILSMNEYGLEFFGYKEEELIGKNFIGLITPVIESTGRHLDDLLLEVFANVEKYPQNINENIKKNGERVWILWTNRPIKDEGGNYLGLFSVGTDVTGRKKAEEDIKRLNETLGILNKILRHDITNNLTVTSMALELMETKDHALKEKAERSIAKSVELIERIRGLEFAASNEKTTGNFEVKKLIEGLIKNYPDTKFNVKGSGIVIADEAFEPVLDNIIRNAIVHGKTDKIDIKITSEKNICMIKIIDYGKGIPDEIKGRIFEEGFSYGEDRSTGLGLYIVKNIIEKYGGEIRVEDNKPSGAVFVLKLKKA